MTTIQVKCVDQNLQILNSPIVASGGLQETAMQFSFCPLWEGFAKTCIFYRNENEIYNVVLNDGTCLIPDEVLQTEGRIYFGVYGVNGERRKTTHILKYDIVKGAFIEGVRPSEPTPDIYEQIITAYGEMEAKCQELIDTKLAKQMECSVTKIPYKHAYITQEAYDELEKNGQLEPNTYYEIINDKTVEQLENKITAIEDRLNTLGFKEGAFIIANGSATTNVIKKQGKYVIASLVFNLTNYEITVPSEFIPKEKVVCSATAFHIQGLEAGIKVEIDTNGSLSVYSTYEQGYLLQAELLNVGWEVA